VAYVEAGADLIFPEAITSLDEYAQIKDADGNWNVVNDEKVQVGQGPTDHVYMLFYIKENS